MCFANNHLVISGQLFPPKKFVIRHHSKTDGTLLKSTWETACKHPLFICKISLVACKFSGTTEESLVYNCTKCKVIYVYEKDAKRFATAIEDSTKFTLCKGPGGTVLAADRLGWCIKQLVVSGTNYQFSMLADLHFEQKCVFGRPTATKAICYAPYCDTLVAVVELDSNEDIWGINLSTGRLLWSFWKHGSDLDFLPKDICYTGQGLVCVANSDNVLSVDPVDGALIGSLFDNDDSITNICEVVCHCEDDGQVKLAIRYGPKPSTKIACFSATFRSSEFDLKYRPDTNQ